MKLSFGEKHYVSIATQQDLAREIAKALPGKEGDVLILAQSEHFYLQAGLSGSGWILERRSGDESSHVSFTKGSALPRPTRKNSWLFRLLLGPELPSGEFSSEEVAEVFSTYFRGEPIVLTHKPGYTFQ
ncbi:MAG: hypothetical protein KYX69_15860 [Sphingomonas sp.]|jgi:hypothetical protein|uniref:hypothetical protein n=1 Tax=Sphingomonas sp. TaxID=28214 RepID=UPI0026094C4F|nr:hypothetical protein [Sphingomonas sp.]MDK2769184.1 hypothetical protein [Sphingomonas sp.]